MTKHEEIFCTTYLTPTDKMASLNQIISKQQYVASLTP